MESIKINDLPFNQFELLGLNKEQVIKMNAEDLKNILSGNRSSIQTFETNEGKIEGKLSILKETDGKLNLLIHPVQKNINNDIGLTDNEIQKIKNGELITKNIDGERHLIQLDKETNEILKAKTKEINIPIEISRGEREKLLLGKKIELKDDLYFQLDLTKPKGYKVSNDIENSQKINISQENNKERDNTKLIIAATLLISPTIGIYFLAKNLLENEKNRLNLSQKDIDTLLEGKKTEIKDLNNLQNDLKGKISFKHNSDGGLDLVIHPVQKNINNDIGLTDNEIQKIKNGELITKNIDGERHLIQLDKETNEILKAKTKEINIPEKINNIPINITQKELILSGQEVQLKNEVEKLSVRADLNNTNKILIKDENSYDNKLENELKQIAKSEANLMTQMSSSNDLNLASHSGKNNEAENKLWINEKKTEFDITEPGISDVVKTDRNRNERMTFENQNKSGGRKR